MFDIGNNSGRFIMENWFNYCEWKDGIATLKFNFMWFISYTK